MDLGLQTSTPHWIPTPIICWFLDANKDVCVSKRARSDRFLHCVMFSFSSVLLTIEIPQLFTPRYGFNAQQIGLQSTGMMVGSVLREQLGGLGSDFFMSRSTRKSGSGKSEPERRIWLCYPGFLTVVIVIVVFFVQVQNLFEALQY